jgi:AcrR family transcriptional regulator
MGPLGRPRTFNRDEALRRAMELFWALGYEGATLSDLQKAMGGITAPSLYAAFGSKEKLFREAVDLYGKTQGIPMARALAEEPTARASIGGLLRAAADAFSQPGKPRGCLLVLSAVNCMPANKSVQDHLRSQRSLRQKIIHQRLQRGVTEGDVPSGANLGALASFYTTVVDGMSIQARDGASRKALRATAAYAMAAWDTLVSEQRRDRLSGGSSEKPSETVLTKSRISQ